MPNTIRQAHRWLSAVFTVAAFVSAIALVLKIEAPWLGFITFVPFVMLMLSGLYMLVRPYLAQRRRVAAV